jgi:hypothetical protein
MANITVHKYGSYKGGNIMRIKSNRRAKFRQYLTTLNRMNIVRKMSEHRKNLLEEIDAEARVALKA